MNPTQSAFGMPAQQMTVGHLQTGPGMSPDLTSRTLSDFNDTVASSGGLRVEFFYHRQPIGGKNTPRIPGSPKFETRLAVAKKPLGDMLTLAVHNITEEDAQRAFPAEWQRFKMYQDAPTNGTPLHELPGATQSMIALLVLGGIRSIEDLTNISEDVLQNMGLDALEAGKLARIWIQRKRGSANDISLAERLTALEAANKAKDEELARLRQETEVSRQTIDALKQIGIGNQTAPSPHAHLGPDVVPAGVPTFGAAHGINQGDDDDDAGGGSDIFTVTELIQGDNVRNMPNPLEE